MDIFAGKVCIITGAASGIGKALAEELAGRGAKVTATDVNTELLVQSVAAIKDKGGTITGRELDVADYEAFKKVVEDVVSQEGRLDYIFNNAGIAIAGEVRDQNIEHWRKVLDVNLYGVIHGSLLAYHQMVKQGSGHIVNMSSVEGLIPFPSTVSYVTSKFAVMGLSEGLWVEGKDLGVDVSVVCPGFVKTPIFDTSEMVAFKREEFKRAISLWERFAVTPEECVRIMLKGVAKKKPIITVTALARLMWWLARISPTFIMNFARKDFNKWRDKARRQAM